MALPMIKSPTCSPSSSGAMRGAVTSTKLDKKATAGEYGNELYDDDVTIVVGDMIVLWYGFVELEELPEKDDWKVGRAPDEIVLERWRRLMGKLGVCSGDFQETESCSKELTRAELVRGDEGEREGKREEDWRS